MILLALFFGLVLRLWNIDVPDLSTDEAQFILGASAAHPPLGMLLFQWALFLHHSILSARMISVIAGFASIGALFAIARKTQSLQAAGMVASVAAVFPGHILFSKTAYLDGLLTLAWLLTVLSFEQARTHQENKNGLSLLFLWATAVASTFLKTQGFLFPLFLLLLRIWEMRKKRPWRDPITGILILSMIPIALYLPTHPSIFATLQLYGGNTFGLQNILTRIAEVLRTQWQMLLLLFPLGILSFPLLKQFPKSVIMLSLLAVLQPLLLGPSHAYYSTAFVIFALPIGFLIARFPRFLQAVVFLLCMGSALAVQLRIPETYWNTHVETLNMLLNREERIVAVGSVGHHVRWYLRPEILVGNTMDLTQWNGMILDMGSNQALPNGTVLYQDERLRLLQVGQP